MSGCEGCFQSQRGMTRQIDTVRAEAKEYAKENNVIVALYQEGYEIRFIKAELSAGLNVIDRVTPY